MKFISQKTQYPKLYKQVISSLKRWEIVLIIFLIFLNIYFIYRQFFLKGISSTAQGSKVVKANDEIWGSFLDNQYPILIILGDDYFLDEYNSKLNRYRQIRDWEIDSENDLSNFLIQYPKENLWKSEITGIPYGGANNLMDILPIIYQFQSDVSLKMSSNLSLEEIRNHNIIYIGEFKNLRVLNKIVYKLPIRFQYNPDERLFIIDENGDTLNTYLRIEAPYAQSNKYNVDYSLLIKIPGFTNEIFMLIVGFGYGGRLERTKMISNPKLRAELIDEIRKMNINVPEYFMVLFEVKSIERTGFTNEIKFFKEISKDFFS